jgi:hypothetical protein
MISAAPPVLPYLASLANVGQSVRMMIFSKQSELLTLLFSLLDSLSISAALSAR